MLVFAYYYLAILYYSNYHDKDGNLEAFQKLNPKTVAISGNLQPEKDFQHCTYINFSTFTFYHKYNLPRS